MNRLLEILKAYRNGESDISEIEQRYDALRQLISDNKDQIELLPSVAYHEAELEAVREVFQDYGDLYISLPENQEESVSATQSLRIEGEMPWAGYWYPKRSTLLFEDRQSPLVKFDHYLANQNIASDTAGWEERHFDKYAAEWEGHCDSWAVAAVLTSEPQGDHVIGGVDFSISDLKALAIKYFEGYKPKVYGRRYEGVAATDGQIQDLRPEAFHRMVEALLGEQKKPLLIDEDSGPEVWAKPLVRMSWKVQMDPDFEHAVRIKAFPWLIKERGRVQNKVTDTSFDMAAPVLEYRLFIDPESTKDGKYKVIAGEWLNSSANKHPDMVFVPGEARNQNQSNQEIAENHENLRKLLVKAGMLQP
jgi:hypothetical protein